MSVKPFSPTESPPPDPVPRSQQSRAALFELVLWALPIILGVAGQGLFGTLGLVLGVIVGLATPLFILLWVE
jgi:hypothetical protein